MKVTLTFNEHVVRRIVSKGYGAMLHWPITGSRPLRAMPDKIAVVDNHVATYTYSALDHAASLSGKLDVSEGY
ncbi:short-chain-fatty-acid--CoA ligase (acyl-CoA synthetase) [Escherichia coli]|uniref:Short-chain-fatty-acid--CoA ligase (Acyl-CoA synthetase) n=1 Tax=Escherichia coli TaxID=562 RepID=A0A376W4D5_ECOLX|nr:short-chain-fatty-acid--CoA ligase (acyl-CoA synthetase) [Escherichia coli]